MGDALWFGNRSASLATVRVSSETFTTSAASHVVKGNAVGIRCTAEADTHLCTPKHPE